MPKLPADNDYQEKYQEAREAWMAFYFSWVEISEISDKEIHTARDGFDAGANWQEKLKLQPENIIKGIQELSPENREIVLKAFR